MNYSGTLLETFLQTTSSPYASQIDSVKCGRERWTYADLDEVSSGIAVELAGMYGLHPTVAIISENHPYVLALMLGVWKIGGIVSPLDWNAPSELMREMLRNIDPTCVVFSSEDASAKRIVSGKPTFLVLRNNRSLTQLYSFQS